jgi:hypothetical protein
VKKLTDVMKLCHADIAEGVAAQLKVCSTANVMDTIVASTAGQHTTAAQSAPGRPHGRSALFPFLICANEEMHRITRDLSNALFSPRPPVGRDNTLYIVPADALAFFATRSQPS